MRIGFVGLGQMGARMAARLVAAGHDLVVHDPAPDAQARLVALGATGTGSPRAVADAADIVLCSLPNPAIVRAVLTGPDGIADGTAARLVVDLSTTGPETTRALAQDLARRSIGLVDAPVSGGTGGAEAGTLSIMASGRQDLFDEVTPLFGHLASHVFYLGAEPGLGQTMKLVNNMLAAASFVATCEATTFGAKAGLDLRTMLDVINVSSGRSFATEIKFPQCILERQFPMRFTTELLLKDVSLGLGEAEKAGTPTWVLGAVRQVLGFAAGQGDRTRDYAHVVEHYERWAGVTLGAAATETGS